MRISRMVAVVGVVSMLALAGCTSPPEEPLPIPSASGAPSATPTPEYTPGVDPEADVAAAIATYEAYVAASNELVVADRTTWEPVLELLAEPYRSDSLNEYQELAREGYSFHGKAQIVSAVATEIQPTIIVVGVCTDVTQKRTRAMDGSQIGEDSDYAVRSMNVVLQVEGDDWLIYHFGESDTVCE